jgi:hypothetical protein
VNKGKDGPTAVRDGSTTIGAPALAVITFKKTTERVARDTATDRTYGNAADRAFDPAGER